MASDSYVVARIVGGLGNQMFQYAAGRALALRLGIPLLVDTSAYSAYRLHRYGLDSLNVDARAAPWHCRLGGKALDLLHHLRLSPQRYLQLVGVQRLAEPPDLAFAPELLTAIPAGPVYVDGYWQNQRYFMDHEAQIRHEFTLRPPLMEEYARIKNQLRSECPCVSLHIRRGDYVSDIRTTATHGVMAEDYYHAAIARMREHIGPDFRIAVFSDDIQWARTNLCFGYETLFVEGDTRAPHIDLFLMASCHHHIIANSSFSWWGAWLNPDLYKVVIAPQRWFHTTQLLSAEICPQPWIRL